MGSEFLAWRHGEAAGVGQRPPAASAGPRVRRDEAAPAGRAGRRAGRSGQTAWVAGLEAHAPHARRHRGRPHRPWSPPTPSTLVRVGAWLIGTDPALALIGRRCVPRRLQAARFDFGHPSFDGALADLLPARPS
ncbi:MAG: DUF1731 domain-containing protein [Acidimicrobiales bacterium]